MKVYTKTGDKGTSQLYSGERREKNNQVFMALGDTDELNASIGLAREFLQATEKAEQLNDLREQLEDIQSRLFDLGSAIATPKSSASEAKLTRTEFAQVHIENLENWIDRMDEELPPLRNFILPSGGLASAQLHVARAVCRRAERQVVPLVSNEQVDAVVGIFLNRLSDYLFVAARYSSLKMEKEETIWKKAKSN